MGASTANMYMQPAQLHYVGVECTTTNEDLVATILQHMMAIIAGNQMGT